MNRGVNNPIQSESDPRLEFLEKEFNQALFNWKVGVQYQLQIIDFEIQIFMLPNITQNYVAKNHEGEFKQELLQFIEKYNLGNSVPNIIIMLRVFLTIAVIITTCERSFSKLKPIKNYSSMSTLRLRNLATLSVEQQLTDEINWTLSLKNLPTKRQEKLLCGKL